MFERKHERVASKRVFIKRLLAHIGYALLLIFISLGIGVSGYHWIAGLNWVDSLLNASMILGGMGPVDALTRVDAKIFASFYALFSGLIFIGIIGVIITPVVHRMIHNFNVEEL